VIVRIASSKISIARNAARLALLDVKVRDIVRLLESQGWRQVRQKGSHRAFKHPEKASVVTVPGHRNDDLPQGTLASIFKKAEVEKS